jgi:hypothetical protein
MRETGSKTAIFRGVKKATSERIGRQAAAITTSTPKIICAL